MNYNISSFFLLFICIFISFYLDFGLIDSSLGIPSVGESISSSNKGICIFIDRYINYNLYYYLIFYLVGVMLGLIFILLFLILINIIDSLNIYMYNNCFSFINIFVCLKLVWY